MGIGSSGVLRGLLKKNQISYEDLTCDFKTFVWVVVQ
jgi:hypothetical protein